MEPICYDINYPVFNKKNCLCEARRTPTGSPPMAPSLKKSSPKITKKTKTNKKNCTLRNPPADEDGYCNKKQSYYYDGCCYIGEKDSKGNLREYKVRGTISKKSPKVKKTKKSTKLVKNTTPIEDQILSDEIKKLYYPHLLEKDINTNKTIVKSYSPEVNKLIKTINEDKTKLSVMRNYLTPKIKNIKESEKGTGPSDDVRYDKMDKEFLKLLADPFVIDKNGKKYKYTSKKAVELLVNNLNKKIDCDKIIAPIQWQSNCWFNSGFMIYFVSDKGRKFNRYLREAMITGSIVKKHNKNVPLKANEKFISNKGIIRKNIKPMELKKLLFIFNLCIEASLSGSQMAYFMDTNFLIRNIHNILNKIDNKNFVKTNKASNPETFYNGLKTYLFEDSSHEVIPIKAANISITEDDDTWDETITPEFMRVAYGIDYIPDMIGISIFDNNDGTAGLSGNIDNKTPEITITFDGQKVKYVLDSVLIRDTSTRHFCCLITCNGNEMGFDGESFHRVSPFKWKSLINKDKDWRFEGSNVDWNFRNGYQKLYYYRV